MLLDTTKLQYSTPNSQLVPQEGPIGVPLILDFSGAVTEYDLDMLLPVEQGRISMVQSIYIDLSNANANVSVTIRGTNQVITAKAGTQGYYPVSVPNPPYLIFTSQANNARIQVILYNVPISGVVWATS